MSFFSATPSYNKLVSGLLDVLLIHYRTLALLRSCNFVPYLECKMMPPPETQRTTWLRCLAQAESLEIARPLVIWQALEIIYERRESPLESLKGVVLPQAKSLQIFSEAKLFEACCNVIAEVAEVLRLMRPLVKDVSEHKLLHKEYLALRGLERYFLTGYRHICGKNPRFLPRRMEIKDLPLKIVDPEFFPLLLNLQRVSELDFLDDYGDLLDFGAQKETGLVCARKVSRQSKRRYIQRKGISEIQIERERSHDFLDHLIELVAKSGANPWLPLQEVKIDRVLAVIHPNCRELEGGALILAMQACIADGNRSTYNRMFWQFLQTHDLSNHWGDRESQLFGLRRVCRALLEERVLRAFGKTIERAAKQYRA